jgi:hypothetical protein
MGEGGGQDHILFLKNVKPPLANDLTLKSNVKFFFDRINRENLSGLSYFEWRFQFSE